MDSDSEPYTLVDICQYNDISNDWSFIGALKCPRHCAGAVATGKEHLKGTHSLSVSDQPVI